MQYTEIIVAVVTTIGVLGAAVLPGYMSNRRKTQAAVEKVEQVAEKIGEPNGHGSLVDMITDVLTLATSNNARIDRLEEADRLKNQKLDMILAKLNALLEEGR